MSLENSIEQNESPEYEAAISDVRSRTADLLETTPEDVTIVNQRETLSENGRWALGFTEQRPSFFKYALRSETSIRLAQEIQAMEAARSVGIPTVGILRSYHEDQAGRGIILLNRLEGNDGTLLADQELIATAPAHFGARAAKGLMQVAGVNIPSHVDTSLLEGRAALLRGSEWKHGESWQPLTFAQLELEREDQQKVVFSQEHQATVETIIGTETLATLFKETWTTIRERIQQADGSTEKYLFHTDPKPENFWFAGSETAVSPALVIDYDLAKITHNQPLAQLIDYGLFYAKAAVNKEMQQAFLATLLQETPKEQQEETHQLLRAAVLYGTMLSVKFSLLEDKVRPFETRKAIPLLGNLQENLAKLEEVYITTQKGPVDTGKG